MQLARPACLSADPRCLYSSSSTIYSIFLFDAVVRHPCHSQPVPHLLRSRWYVQLMQIALQCMRQSYKQVHIHCHPFSGAQELLEAQMGMSLPAMCAFCQSDAASRSKGGLPGAHLPSKGFWLIKRPTAPSTAAAPSVPARLLRKMSFRPATATPSLRQSSDGL